MTDTLVLMNFFLEFSHLTLTDPSKHLPIYPYLPTYLPTYLGTYLTITVLYIVA